MLFVMIIIKGKDAVQSDIIQAMISVAFVHSFIIVPVELWRKEANYINTSSPEIFRKLSFIVKHEITKGFQFRILKLAELVFNQSCQFECQSTITTHQTGFCVPLNCCQNMLFFLYLMVPIYVLDHVFQIIFTQFNLIQQTKTLW